MKRLAAFLWFGASVAIGCGGSADGAGAESTASATTSGSGGHGATGSGSSGAGGAMSTGSAGGSLMNPPNPGPNPGAEQVAELWYSVGQLRVRAALAPGSGALVGFQASPIESEMPFGQNAITMVKDGGLLGARLAKSDLRTHLYWIPEPPRDGSAVAPLELGVMPDELMLEGLYTDCEGRVYGMDTGSHDTNAEGNRLLRFTGDVTAGDFSFTVVSDLATADVADIDDMSPGIADNAITDNPGLAIDTGRIHAFNFETGTGTEIATGGTFGIHALGGTLFEDGRSRLYVLSNDAELFELDPKTLSSSPALGEGPSPAEGPAGWSGLAGPLTDCKTGFVPK